MYIYERLRQHLDSFVLRAPEGGGILEILRIRFSPEEAEVALLMGPDHRAPAQVAAGTRFSESEMHSIRITSYNVCYTKLLRSSIVGNRLQHTLLLPVQLLRLLVRIRNPAPQGCHPPTEYAIRGV